MKRGQLVFVKGTSIISKLINLIDGVYCHVALALSENTVLESQRFAESRIIKNYHERYDLVDITLTDDQMRSLIDSSLNFIGYDYDYKQIAYTFFGEFFKISRFNDRGKFICSELIVEVLFDIGYFNDSEYAKLVHATPNELFQAISDKEKIISTPEK